jgi:DNA transformation protein
MAKRSEFVAHLLDLLAPLGGVTARSMFGGWGFSRNDRMFALVAHETFYVKVDDSNRADFTNLGLEPFAYETRSGKREVMSYYTVPAEALDSSPLLCEWATRGIEASLRTANRSKPKSKKAPAKRGRQK